MKFVPILLLILSMSIFMQSEAQQVDQWNNKQCAVVLTYDDALNVHLDNVIPALDSLGLKGTFYIIGNSPILSKRMSEWRLAAKHGHELGNHTLNHPCDGSIPGRSWVTRENDLIKYSFERAVNEIRVTNTLLQAIDGKTERTFAYPCGDLKVDTITFYPTLEHDFVGARGVGEGMQSLNKINLNNIDCFAINGQSGDYMIDLVKKAMESHTLLVFLFHGVGGEHNINVSLEAHRQLIQFLKQHENEIWIAPLVDVAKYIREKQVIK